MRNRLKIPPTKSALLSLKRQVVFLQQGHDLLEHKRELLTRLVYQRLAQYRALRKEVRSALELAYRGLAITHMRMSHRALQQATLGLAPALEVHVLPRTSIGVEYPAVTVEVKPLQPVGLLWTDVSFDDTRARMAQSAMLLAKQAEAETALWRLLAEQRKTQKRVNALKYNIIPRYEATISYVESALEEEERMALYQVRRGV